MAGNASEIKTLIAGLPPLLGATTAFARLRKLEHSKFNCSLQRLDLALAFFPPRLGTPRRGGSETCEHVGRQVQSETAVVQGGQCQLELKILSCNYFPLPSCRASRRNCEWLLTPKPLQASLTGSRLTPETAERCPMTGWSSFLITAVVEAPERILET